MFSVLVCVQQMVILSQLRCVLLSQKALKVASESMNIKKFPGGEGPQTPLASARYTRAGAAHWPYHFLCASDGPVYSYYPLVLIIFA